MLYLLTILCFLWPYLTVAAAFSSWIDVKAECGAVGDGKADDTAAIQKGLDLIRPEDSKRKILYFPAGTYRITGTIQAVREKHRESQGIGLQGEGPDQSVLVYDGKGNEPMLRWGAWYSTIRSLGFQPKEVEGGRREVEGGAKPTTGIWFGPNFSTANEVSDCAFRDLPIALQAGTEPHKDRQKWRYDDVCLSGAGSGYRSRTGTHWTGGYGTAPSGIAGWDSRMCQVAEISMPTAVISRDRRRRTHGSVTWEDSGWWGTVRWGRSCS